jgi:hypothetical protein
MKILCVEDGSVDLDALEREPLRDGKILVYRQGATLPYVLELNDNDAKLEELLERRAFAVRELKEIQTQLVRNNKRKCLDYIVNRIKELGGGENE